MTYRLGVGLQRRVKPRSERSRRASVAATDRTFMAGSSEDRAPWRQFDGGNATREQDEQPITVLATEDTRIGCQCGDDAVDDVVLIGGIRILIPDVGMVAAGEPDTKHDLSHEGTLAAAVLTCHAVGSPIAAPPCSLARTLSLVSPSWRVTVERLHAAWQALGEDTVPVEPVLVSTASEAEQPRFVGSSTVLIDGKDPFAERALPVGSSGAPTVEHLIDASRA